MADLYTPLDISLWNSGTRIYASHKAAYLGQAAYEDSGAGIIPPDVAVAIDLLRQQEIVNFASIINSAREQTPVVNDALVQKRIDLKFETVLDKITDQYAYLRAAPTMTENSDYIWHDMPPELYLVNRIGSEAESNRSYLDALRYYDSFDAAQTGADVFVPNEEDAKAAQDARKVMGDFGYKMTPGPLGIPLVVWGIVTIVGSAFAIWDVLDAIKKANADDEAVELAKSYSTTMALNLKQAESTEEMLKFCLRHAEQTGSAGSECDKYQAQMAPYVAPPSLDARPGISAGLCQGSACTTWLLLGGLVGALGGWKIGKSLISKE